MAISLITALDDQILHDIQRLLPTPLERVVTTGFEIAPASRPSSHRGESRLKRSVSIQEVGRLGPAMWSSM
jgi:hypothetical protein